MRAIGIDIGSYSIKVAELEGQLKNMVVRDFHEFPLTHEPGQDVRLEKIEILRKIASLFEPKTYSYVVGLGSEFSTCRVLNFPFNDRRKIFQSLPFELEDAIPFSQSDAIFDFRIIYQKPNASRVLAIAVPKKYVQEILILCEEAGISPDVITPDGIALANHFDRNYSNPGQYTSTETVAGGKTELFIHIGYTKTLVDVIQDQKLVASRAIYFGGRDLANTVMRSYQLPYLEALKGVSEKAFVLTSDEGADQNQVAFSKVLSQGLSILTAEIQRTMVELKAELESDFTAAYLTGGMGRIINLGPWLSQKLGIQVDIVEHLGKTLRTDIPVTEQNDKASAIAIGLAVEAFRKPKHPAINLRRNEFSKQSQVVQQFIERYKDLAKIGAAFIVFLYVYAFMRVSVTEENLAAVGKAIKEQAKNSALNIPPSQLKPEGLKKYIKAKHDEIESKRQVLRLEHMQSALDVMRQVSSALPGKNQITLDVKHFSVNGETLALEGTVNSKNEFDLLQRSLAQVTGVTGVTATTPHLAAAAGKTPFSFTMKVARLPAAERKK